MPAGNGNAGGGAAEGAVAVGGYGAENSAAQYGQHAPSDVNGAGLPEGSRVFGGHDRGGGVAESGGLKREVGTDGFVRRLEERAEALGGRRAGGQGSTQRKVAPLQERFGGLVDDFRERVRRMGGGHLKIM